MQYVIVGVTIALAAVYLAVRLYRSISRRCRGGSGSRCDGCTQACALRTGLASKATGESQTESGRK